MDKYPLKVQKFQFKLHISILYLTLLIFLSLNNVRSEEDEFFYPNDDICGMTEENENDLRTLSPWKVVIYLRESLKSPFEYFLTGTLVGENTVISGFGGGFGHSPNLNKRYFIPPASHFFIAAATKSTDFLDADEHTQYANISYVATHNSISNNFHYVIFRLTKILDIKTPYVRPVCLPFFLPPFLRSQGIKGPLQNTLGLSDYWNSVGGFNAPPGAQEPFKHVIVSGKSDYTMRCMHSYKRYYKLEPGEKVGCFRIDLEYSRTIHSAEVSNSTCLTHGSGMVLKTSQFMINVVPALGPEPRFYFTGVVALIPRRDLGQCNLNTTYYTNSFAIDLQWMKDHIICKNPQTFPCTNGTCIPLEQVCDEKQDCDGGEDEEPVYCSATKRCDNRDDYQCGYGGKCIKINQVGDGILDCPSGSDEDEKLLNNTRFSKEMETKKTKECFPLLTTEGVVVKCTHHENSNVSCSNAPIGSEAIFGCAPNYSSQQRFNYAIIKCYADGTWKPFREFKCQHECGLLVDEIKNTETDNGLLVHSQTDFPWHAAIFKERNDATLEYICGASLIERNVVITAAHCVTAADGNDIDVEQIMRSRSDNTEARQPDIVILKLDMPVVYTQTIRPVCYVMQKYLNLPLVNSIGTIPGFGGMKTGGIAEKLQYAHLKVVSMDDCDLKRDDQFCTQSKKDKGTICYGDSGGGLVFSAEKGSGGLTKFILKGIATELSKPQGIDCHVESKATSVFTQLDSHSEWLLTNLEEIEVSPDL